MYDKTELKENLTNCIAEVKFTKADGTLREMHCTLMPEYIVSEHKEAILPRKQNDEVLAVWDLDKGAWRSFRIDSITNINYIGVNRV